MTIAEFEGTDYTGGDYGSSYSCNANGITSLKGCPAKVSGSFSCYDNELTTLEYCPKEIFGSFRVQRNKLKSLQHGPEGVAGDYIVAHNKLKDLVGSPKMEIYGEFNCSFNKLTSLKGAPTRIEGSFNCEGNPTLKNVRQEIINNDIRAKVYYTDEGEIRYSQLADEFKKKDMNKRVTRTSMRTLLGLDK